MATPSQDNHPRSHRSHGDILPALDRYLISHSFAPLLTSSSSATSASIASVSPSVSASDYLLLDYVTPLLASSSTASSSSPPSYRHIARWQQTIERSRNQTGIAGTAAAASITTPSSSISSSVSLDDVIAAIITKVSSQTVTAAISETKETKSLSLSSSSLSSRAKRGPQVGIAFKPYPSIENCEAAKIMKKIEAEGFAEPKIEWVVTEKVHGSNFSFCVDADSIQCFKRSGPVQDDENFYGHLAVLERYRDRLRALYNDLQSSRPDVDNITVFGELFGGSYPHADVAKIPGVAHVQKYLWYCPHHEFFGFDISLNRRGFLDFDDMTTLFARHKFFYSLPLRRGTYQHCLEWQVEGFQTTIPPLLGMPELKDNFAEGVCCRAVKSAYLSNSMRVLVKKKRSDFSEMGAKPGVEKKKKKIVKPRTPGDGGGAASDATSAVELPDDVQDCIDDVIRYITPQRVRSVISKIGTPKRHEIPRVNGLLVKDALDDFKKNSESFEALNDKHRRTIITAVTKAATDLIAANIDNIVAGDF